MKNEWCKISFKELHRAYAPYIVVPFVFSAFISIGLKWRYGYSLEESLFRAVFSPFETTLKAEGFTEVNFRKITVGMSIHKVKKLCGEPLAIEKNENGTLWKYTMSDAREGWVDFRNVYFGRDNRVTEIANFFN